MKSRLRKVANNVSPNMHREVEKHITDKDGNRYRIQQANMAFLLAKRLLAALPMVPTNERVYELAQDITVGKFDDICPIEESEDPNNWDKWVERTKQLLIANGILI